MPKRARCCRMSIGRRGGWRDESLESIRIAAMRITLGRRRGFVAMDYCRGLGICFCSVLIGLFSTTHAAELATKKIDYARQIKPILSNTCSSSATGRTRMSARGEPTACGSTRPRGACRPGRLRGDRAGQAGGERADRAITSDDPDEGMPPRRRARSSERQEIELLRPTGFAQGAQYAAALVVRQAACGPRCRRCKTEPGRATRSTTSSWPGWSAKGLQPVARGRPLRPDPPRLARPDRPAADAGGGRDGSSTTTDPHAYEKLVDRLLAIAALRRALGGTVARPGPLRRLGRLRRRPAAHDLALPRLRHPVAQRQQAVRPVHRSSRSPATCCPNPTEEQLIATAFHRNTLTNNEGGTNDEEFRNVAVVDRVNTTMAVWMGTTIACAQCHDHKYDPITQKEYLPLLRDLQQHRGRRPRPTRPPWHNSTPNAQCKLEN